MSDTPPLSPLSPTSRPLQMAHWLLMVAGLVIIMVVVGGITRLTESGLSITEWKPVTGALPPLSHEQWLVEFHKYQQTPEYIEINRGMSLDNFKFIFFWEWFHRLLGRLIGMAFALPFLWFAVKKAIPRGFTPRLIVLLAMGGFQGLIGWWMVVSGLVDRTDVSHYRLAVHLITALLIIAGLVWTSLDLRQLARDPYARPARLTPFAIASALVLLVQLLWGAYVAGLNAGYVASDWPLMNDHFVPEGIMWQGSFWATITSDPFLIHFFHRWWAWVTGFMLLLLSRKAKRAGHGRAATTLLIVVALQIALGITTVLTHIHLHVAVTHQGVGALLVAATAWAAHSIGLNSDTAITPQKDKA
ncbi:MAG: heme A synthase [Sphingobium sp.]|nr:heme A synthase [Sphingobium sp.]